MPFLGSALGLTAMCSLGWGNFDWNDLPVGRELDCKFLFGVVDDTTTTKFTGRACAVHCNSLLVVKEALMESGISYKTNRYFANFLKNQPLFPEGNENHGKGHAC